MHVVFTLPHALLPLAYRNATRLYTWLFQASAATLREVAADPRHLGAEIGILSILHTWGQRLVGHPHVHCVVPAGGVSTDHQQWIRPKYAGFFLPIKVLSRVFVGSLSPRCVEPMCAATSISRALPRACTIPPAGTLRRCALRHRLGRRCQTGLRPGVSGPSLPRALYPSGRDQQPSLDRL
jgi:hypothetical protein